MLRGIRGTGGRGVRRRVGRQRRQDEINNQEITPRAVVENCFEGDAGPSTGSQCAWACDKTRGGRRHWT
eukprot:5550723-Pyramimonas_sp.AAC.1